MKMYVKTYLLKRSQAKTAMQKLRIILAGVILFSLFLPASLAQVQDENLTLGEEPAIVQVSAYVLSIGKFEVATGSYTVDFYLDMTCETPCSPGNFEFANGRATSIDKLIDEPQEKFYRIQAVLLQNIDLRNYPFDNHTLVIELEDKTKTTSEQIYIANKEGSGIDPTVVLVGWELRGWNSEVKSHHYEPYNETYSRYSFGIQIGRVGLTSVIKSFLPVFFMVLVALLSLLLAADKVTTRLTLNISTLLAAVMFHLNLTSSIPPTGYLTFADKFMIITYVIMLVVLFSGIDLMRHTERKDDTMAGKIYKTALISIPIFTLVSYVILFAVF
jgi:hypothetical protein